MSWKPLNPNRATDSELPVLLVSAVFRSDSYTIHLTDLTHIWSESLDRRAIFQRSKDENTSIDPRDGDQLRVLLDKIRLGIEGGGGSTTVLTVSNDTGKPCLTLNVTVDLPGGLSPLEWPIHLDSASQSLLTEQLTIPLLEAQQMRMQERTSLGDLLREKDQVIQKLIDKLESQGTQLGQVFPQAAGKPGRKFDRKSAEEKVKGLKQFDMQVWRGRLEKVKFQDIGQLVGQVFQDGTTEVNIKESSNIWNRPENWWDTIKGKTVSISSGKSTSAELSKTVNGDNAVKSTPKEEDSIRDDDDFQVQSTPPHLASPKEKLAAQQPTEDSTDDDDDLDAPSQRSKIPDSLPPSQPPAKSPVKMPKKLGLIGGRKEPPKPIPEDDDETTEGSTPSPPRRAHSREQCTASPVAAPSPAKPKRTLGRLGGKKATPEPEEPPPAKEEPKPSRGRLGQVGGKKKEVTPVPPEQETDTLVSPTKPVEEKKKLGSLGGRKSKRGEEETAVVPEEPRGRAVKQEEQKEPPHRETSEERANKKREQLKMELEEKAKAPVKKKRKF